MRRREFLSVVAAAASRFTAGARAGEPVGLGYVWIGVSGSDGPTLAGIRQGLAEVGPAEHRDVVLVTRYADGHPERLAPLTEELLRHNVVVLLGWSLCPHRSRTFRTLSVRSRHSPVSRVVDWS